MNKKDYLATMDWDPIGMVLDYAKALDRILGKGE